MTSNNQFLYVGFRGQGETEKEFIERKMNERDMTGETAAQFVERTRTARDTSKGKGQDNPRL